MDQERIDPAQRGFWDCLDARHLEPGEIEPFGVEYVVDPERLRELRHEYPCPTAVNAGHGIFSSAVGLVFVDDETGRAIAYAPPIVVLRTAIDDRAETIGVLRDGLVMIDAIACDQWSDAGATLRQMHDAAIETLRKAGALGLDAGGNAASHSQAPGQG